MNFRRQALDGRAKTPLAKLLGNSGWLHYAVAGTSYGPTSTRPDFAVARLSSDGSLDASFGSGGKTTISFGPYDEAAGVAIDSSGRA